MRGRCRSKTAPICYLPVSVPPSESRFLVPICRKSKKSENRLKWLSNRFPARARFLPSATVEGRERYPVSVRYARELRDDPERLKRVLVPAMNGAQIPLGQLADVRLTSGPAMIRDEDAQLAGYVFVDMTGRDIGSYVEEAQKRVAEQDQIPA